MKDLKLKVCSVLVSQNVTDIKNFRQGQIKGNKMIFFDYTEEHKKWKSGEKIAKFLSGKEGAVQSSYNIKTEQLLSLMKEYKSKSIKRCTTKPKLHKNAV